MTVRKSVIQKASYKVMRKARRVEAGQRRTDRREWVIQGRERTRHLIELGGLVQKAGLVDLTDDDRAALYGAMLELAAEAREDGKVLALWKRRAVAHSMPRWSNLSRKAEL